MTVDNRNFFKDDVAADWKMDGKPALLIMHMQKGIVGTGIMTPVPHQESWEAIKKYNIIEKQTKLANAFRAKKLPVIFGSVMPRPARKCPQWGAIYRNQNNMPDELQGDIDNPVVLDLCQIIPEMKRQPSDYVTYHWGIGAFNNSGLDAILQMEGVKTVVVTGWTAHSTCYNAIIACTERYYNVILPKDATNSPASVNQEGAYEAVIKCFAPMWALVTTVDDVIAHL